MSRSADRQLIQPVHTFGSRPSDPVPTNRGGEVDSAERVTPSQASPKHRPNVVDLEVHPVEPLGKPVTTLSDGLLAPRPVIRGGSIFNHFLLASLAQFEARKFAHRLVQPIASHATNVLFDEEGLVDQRRQQVQ